MSLGAGPDPTRTRGEGRLAGILAPSCVQRLLRQGQRLGHRHAEKAAEGLKAETAVQTNGTPRARALKRHQPVADRFETDTKGRDEPLDIIGVRLCRRGDITLRQKQRALGIVGHADAGEPPRPVTRKHGIVGQPTDHLTGPRNGELGRALEGFGAQPGEDQTNAHPVHRCTGAGFAKSVGDELAHEEAETRAECLSAIMPDRNGFARV